MKPQDRKDVDKKLKDNGFIPVNNRGKGSHTIYRNPSNGKSISIPYGKEVSPGIGRQLEKLIPSK